MIEKDSLSELENISPSAWITLKKIAYESRYKLLSTFGLVALENIMFMSYPIFAGIAINAILKGKLWVALTYAIVVFVFWGVGAIRRIVDTRVFARLYAEKVISVILNQREKGSEVSTTVARVTLSREFINFFEEHLPLFVTSIFSVIGAVFMLIFIEFWVGIFALIILTLFILTLPKLTKRANELYFNLNNQMEKEVEKIDGAGQTELESHYGLMAKIRIEISNREAYNYLIIGIMICLLFAFSITMMTLDETVDAGHIYSVMTYLWMFAMSLDDSPKLIEQFSKLRDIGQRVEVFN